MEMRRMKEWIRGRLYNMADLFQRYGNRLGPRLPEVEVPDGTWEMTVAWDSSSADADRIYDKIHSMVCEGDWDERHRCQRPVVSTVRNVSEEGDEWVKSLKVPSARAAEALDAIDEAMRLHDSED